MTQNDINANCGKASHPTTSTTSSTQSESSKTNDCLKNCYLEINMPRNDINANGSKASHPTTSSTQSESSFELSKSIVNRRVC